MGSVVAARLPGTQMFSPVSLVRVMVVMVVVMVRCERVPGLVEWEAHQRAVLQAENQLLAEAPQVEQTVQTVPGIEQWEAQHRAALAAQNIRQEEEKEGSLQSEQTTTETSETVETAETVATSTSTSATQTGLKSILELSFQRLVSKLKLRQNDNQDDDEYNNDNNNDDDDDDGENSKTNNLSILLAKKEEESGNSNYLDLLLNSYNLDDKGTQREKSFRKHSSSFDENLFVDAEHYDYDTGDGDRQRYSNRFRFLYEDDSDISFAVKQSRQLDQS